MISHSLTIILPPVSRRPLDPPKVTFIHLDDRGPTSLTLSWTLSRRAPAHISHHYELMYRQKVRPRLLCLASSAPVEAVESSPPILFLAKTDSLFWQNGDGARDVTTYKVLILEKNSIQINDLNPDSTYMFKVQAVGPDGNSGSYSMEQEFHTSPLGTDSLKIFGMSPLSVFYLKLINALGPDFHSRVSDPEQVYDGDGRSGWSRGDPAGGGGRPAAA